MTPTIGSTARPEKVLAKPLVARIRIRCGRACGTIGADAGCGHLGRRRKRAWLSAGPPDFNRG